MRGSWNEILTYLTAQVTEGFWTHIYRGLQGWASSNRPTKQTAAVRCQLHTKWQKKNREAEPCIQLSAAIAYNSFSKLTNDPRLGMKIGGMGKNATRIMVMWPLWSLWQLALTGDLTSPRELTYPTNLTYPMSLKNYLSFQSTKVPCTSIEMLVWPDNCNNKIKKR